MGETLIARPALEKYPRPLGDLNFRSDASTDPSEPG